MNKKILPYILQLIKENNLLMTFIDVGSRNGVLELADLAEFIDAYGFEPNPEEYNKLISGKTDAFTLCKVKSPNYRKLSYYPYALNNKTGEDEFYVTPGPGAAGLLEPNLDYLRQIIWKGKKYKNSFGDDIFNNYKKIKVKIETLDNFVNHNNISYIDYLKIDVEGSEYEVLEGAKNILPRTGVIKAEVCFVPFRKRQKLFSEVDIFLRKYGFELLNYDISPAQIGYKIRTEPFQHTPVDFPDPKGQPLSVDAIYVNGNINDKQRLISQVAILLDKNYIDEALYILKNKIKLDNKELLNLLKNIQVFGDTTGQKLRGIGYCLVDDISFFIKKILGK